MTETPEIKEPKIYCDNPQCDREITSQDKIAYNNAEREIYHDSNCAMMAGAVKAFKTRTVKFTSFQYLTRKRVLELLAEENLKQGKLEKKLGEKK